MAAEGLREIKSTCRPPAEEPPLSGFCVRPLQLAGISPQGKGVGGADEEVKGQGEITMGAFRILLRAALTSLEGGRLATALASVTAGRWSLANVGLAETG